MAITYATYVQGRPQMEDYVAPAAVNAGDLIITGATIRIAHLDIAAGELGALAIDGGVYTFPKATTGGSAIADNTIVYWDNTNKVITTTSAGNKRLGYTFGTSLDTDATQRVLHYVA